jgi:hypothetical protein
MVLGADGIEALRGAGKSLFADWDRGGERQRPCTTSSNRQTQRHISRAAFRDLQGTNSARIVWNASSGVRISSSGAIEVTP